MSKSAQFLEGATFAPILGCSKRPQRYLNATTSLCSLSVIFLSIAPKVKSAGPDRFAKSGKTSRLGSYGGHNRGGRGKRRFICPPTTRSTKSKRTGEPPLTIQVFHESQYQVICHSNIVDPRYNGSKSIADAVFQSLQKIFLHFLKRQ